MNIEQIVARTLNSTIIDQNVNDSCGNYALGDMSNFGDNVHFIPKYIGRSDSILKTEIYNQGIQNKTDKSGNPKYTYFVFSHEAKTPKQAYIIECEMYHKYEGQIENKNHPARPKDFTKNNLKCPVCGV